MYAMVGKATMSGTDLPTSFSWKHGFFVNQSNGLYNCKAPAKAMEKRNLKKQCPTAKHALQQSQWNGTTSAAVLMSPKPIMTANPALPITLNMNSATATMTETIGGNGKHKSITSSARSHRTASHLTLKHDDSHIHRASPICRLPPKDKTIKNAPAGNPPGNIKISASNKLHLAKLMTSRDRHPQDRGQESAMQVDSKFELINLQVTTGNQSPMDMAGTQNGESRIHTHLWQLVTTSHQHCHQNIDNIQSDQTITFAQPLE